MTKKTIFAICGSTKQSSTNLRLLQYLTKQYSDRFDWRIYQSISQLPHFNPDLENDDLPKIVDDFRTAIASTDAVIICTPEYVFSLPGSLKNALDWTVSTIVFSDKPSALITAAMSGEKAHDSLALIMRTIGATFTDETQLLIQGAKSKIDSEGNVLDEALPQQLDMLITALEALTKA